MITRQCLLLATCVGLSGAAALPIPQVFAPGIISGPANDGSPTFSPDGNTLFFTRSSARWSIILESHKLQGQWSEPRVASFSGKWSDSSPAMSPDGSSIVFVSSRLLKPVSEQAAPASNGAGVRMASHVWQVKRTAAGWDEPIELPQAVNFCDAIFRPSIAADGSIYFTAAGQGKNLRLFRSRLQGGAYKLAEPLPFSDGTLKDVDPEIAPDQSFLIFTSLGRGSGDGTHEKLFIAYAQGGAWDKVLPLRYVGDDAHGSSDDNDARLGNDHRTLYFSSDRSLAVQFPRSRQQADQDFERLQKWDNGNSNVWFLSLTQ